MSVHTLTTHQAPPWDSDGQSGIVRSTLPPALSGATSSRRLCAGYHGTMMTRSCTGPDDSTRRANA